MELRSQAARNLLLLVLLGSGIGVIWHLGHNLIPRKLAGLVGSAPFGPSADDQAPLDSRARENSTKKTKLAAGLKALQSRKGFPRLVVTSRGRFLATQPILFNTGLAELRDSSVPALNRLAPVLKNTPEIQLLIIGHTDNLGNESVNQKLSADRAAAVRDYLVKQGIAAWRLKSKGMGSKDPISTNDTRQGRQANRRIEFLMTHP